MHLTRLTLLSATLALLSGCTGITPYSPGADAVRSRRVVSDVPSSIAALANELESRASLRSSLGSARILVEAPEPIGPRRGRHRFAILDEDDVEAVQDTIKHELEKALGNRLNVLDPSAVLGDAPTGDAEADSASLRDRLGATHAVVGTFVRSGDQVDLSLRLVDLRDGWIVATAERRIEGFVPRAGVRLRSNTPGEASRSTLSQRTTAMGDLRSRNRSRSGASTGLDSGSRTGGARTGDAMNGGIGAARSDGVQSKGIQSQGTRSNTFRPNGAASKAAAEREVTAQNPANPQLVTMEPEIPEGATIEFDVGPAAARLGSRAKPVTPPPSDGPAGVGELPPAPESAASGNTSRGEHY